MPRVIVNRASLEYTEDGGGQSVVLVHGSASDYRTWQSQRTEFSKRFRVISYSRRYHWPNDPIGEGADYSMSDQVDDLNVLLNELDAIPAHLVGHSYGGFLCLLLAINRPDIVRTLVMAEPPVITLFLSNSPTLSELLTLLVTRPRTAIDILRFGVAGVAPAVKAFKRHDLEMGIRAFGNAVFGRGGYDSLSEPKKRQVLDNRSNIRAELLGSGFAPLDADSVRSVRCPTLLVTGERSVGLFHRLADRLQELLPGSTPAALPGARHLIHEDNAPAYNRAVLACLEGPRV